MTKAVTKWGIIGAATAAGVLLVDSMFLEKYFFEITNYTIGNANGTQKIKVVLLTDLHLKRWFRPYYKKLANTVNALEPDLILIAGDVVDEHGSEPPADKFFSLLDKSIPKAVIMGNHDHKSEVSLKRFKQMYDRHGVHFLMNTSHAFSFGNKRLMVTGLDDFIEGEASFEAAVKGVGREDGHVLLVHSPKQQEKTLKQLKRINKERSEEDRLRIQYIFAGHNHGGQVKFLGYAPIMPKKAGNYMNGWYNSHPPFLYVSRGFGTSTLPFRFGARSEVTVFDYWL